MDKAWETVNKEWNLREKGIPHSFTSEEFASLTPAVVEWLEEQKRKKKREEDNSFEKDERNRPGALIEVRDFITGEVRILLIGHIHPKGGGCGCCCELADRDLVLRVKQVWEPEQA
jgi:CO dehydrogenase nickel-insertion accessory protein CooC1